MKVVQTSDGSSTLFSKKFRDHYHSLHGAEQEARHVFIEMGLLHVFEKKKRIKVLEVGFGTGLNAILTLDFARKHKTLIEYSTIEPFPIESSVISKLKFPVTENHTLFEHFVELHSCDWNTLKQIIPGFEFLKIQTSFNDQGKLKKNDLIYYDAFGPRYQPEMWGEDAAELISGCLNNNGKVVTYCAQGAFRRNLEKVGLVVERLPGPPGKREMIRATKVI